MSVTSERLKKLKAQRAAFDAKIKREEQRIKSANRKADTRRKIIVGALALNHMDKNPNSDFGRKMTALINEYVIKDTERALFDLPPLPEQPPATSANPETKTGTNAPVTSAPVTAKPPTPANQYSQPAAKKSLLGNFSGKN